MTDTTTTEHPERVTETWLYAGVRVSGGKRTTAWQIPGQEGLSYFTLKSANYAVGYAYEVSVEHHDGGGMTMWGQPKWAGTIREDRTDDEQEQAVKWAAADQIARTKLAAIARERKARKQSELDEALRPLMRIAHDYRQQSDQDALIAYVIRKVHSAWAYGPDEL
jgi:hypothetical protein